MLVLPALPPPRKLPRKLALLPLPSLLLPPPPSMRSRAALESELAVARARLKEKLQNAAYMYKQETVK